MIHPSPHFSLPFLSPSKASFAPHKTTFRNLSTQYLTFSNNFSLNPYLRIHNVCRTMLDILEQTVKNLGAGHASYQQLCPYPFPDSFKTSQLTQ